MTSKRDPMLLTTAALIPMFGGGDKKERVIDREVVTLGRARGCDFCLDANEVSALHSVIYRTHEGYRVRDCGSRTGTRINGESIKNELLKTGDILQLGPFSFEIRMPKTLHGQGPANGAAPIGATNGTNGTAHSTASDDILTKLQRSRKNLARMALVFRRKLHQAGKHPKSNAGGVPHDLLDRAEEVKHKIKQYDQRLHQLEESEQELMEEREILEKEKHDFRQQMDDMERDLQLRREKLEREMQVKMQEIKKSGSSSQHAALPAQPSPEEAQKLEALRKSLEQREAALRAETEQLVRDREALQKEVNDKEQTLLRKKETLEKELHAKVAEIKKQAQSLAQHRPSTPTAEEEAKLEGLRKELDEREQHVRKLEDEWKAKDTQLNDDYANFARERQDLVKLKQQWDDDQLQARAHFDRQRQFLAQAEEALQLQKSQLTDMMGELKKVQESLKRRPASGEFDLTKQAELQKENLKLMERTAQLERENQELRGKLRELEERLAQPAVDPGLEDKISQLSKALQESERRYSQLAQEVQNRPEPAAVDTSALEEENKRLRQALEKLAELDAENQTLRQMVEQLESRPAPAASGASGGSEEVDEIKAENKTLRQILTEYEEKMASLKDGGGIPEEFKRHFLEMQEENQYLRRHIENMEAGGSAGEMSAEIRERIEQFEKIKEENDVLKNLIKDKETEMAQIREGDKLPEGVDPESYEAELNKFRRQLEADRSRLNKEMEALRTRNRELDEAVREMEMELSRERADLGRERIRLDRMREEIKNEMERMQREAGVRETLAPVQKLRDELNSKRQGTSANVGKPADKNLVDRLRNIRG